MSTIDQQFVEFVIKAIVNHPDDVKVEREIVVATGTLPNGTKKHDVVNLRLTVHPEDVGRVIGRHGDTARSMRTLLMALGTKNELIYYYKINDNSEEKNERRETSEEKPAKTPDQKSDTKKPLKQKAAPEKEEPALEEAESTPDTTVEEILSEPEEQPKSVDTEDVESLADKHRKDLEDLNDFDI